MNHTSAIFANAEGLGEMWATLRVELRPQQSQPVEPVGTVSKPLKVN